MIDTIFNVFAFGTIGFWIVIAILSVIYTAATEQDTHGFAIFATLLGALLLWKPLSLAISNWQLTLIVILLYAAIGGVWSVWRWLKFCRDFVKQHSGEKESFYRNELNPSRYKSYLIGCIVYWPWSAFWNITGDFFTAIYDTLTNVYNKTAQYAIRKAIGSRVP